MDKDTDINFISVLLVTFNSLMHTIYLIELKKERIRTFDPNKNITIEKYFKDNILKLELTKNLNGPIIYRF